MIPCRTVTASRLPQVRRSLPGFRADLLEAETAVDGAAVPLLAADPLSHQALLSFDAELVNERPLGHLEELQLQGERERGGGSWSDGQTNSQKDRGEVGKTGIPCRVTD